MIGWPLEDNIVTGTGVAGHYIKYIASCYVIGWSLAYRQLVRDWLVIRISFSQLACDWLTGLGASAGCLIFITGLVIITAELSSHGEVTLQPQNTLHTNNTNTTRSLTCSAAYINTTN